MARQREQDQAPEPDVPTARQDEFKAAARGKPVSQIQVDALNAIRPTLQPAPTFDPPGADAAAIREREAARLNRLIDQEIAFQTRRMERQRGGAANDFNQARDRRGKEPGRRNEDRER